MTGWWPKLRRPGRVARGWRGCSEGYGLIAGEVLRRSAIRMLSFIAAAGVVLWIVWPGSSSDSGVLVNRIEIPVYLVLLALAPLLVRRFFGPVRDGLLTRMVRVGGYGIVLALITANAVERREGQKLGAYFADGGTVAGLIVLVIAGYIVVLLWDGGYSRRWGCPS